MRHSTNVIFFTQIPEKIFASLKFQQKPEFGTNLYRTKNPISLMNNRKGEREKKRKRKKGKKKAGQKEEEGTRTGRTRKPII